MSKAKFTTQTIPDILLEDPATSASDTLLFLQSGAGAVARTVQSKERDIFSSDDYATIGDYNTQVATLAAAGSTKKYTLNGSLNFPGGDQSRAITWNSPADGNILKMYRLGAGRLGIQMTLVGTNGDQAIDITNSYVAADAAQGTNRLRLWGLDANAEANQNYLEIYLSRDIGFEGAHYNIAKSGTAPDRRHVWEISDVAKMQLVAGTGVAILSATSGVHLQLGSNAAAQWEFSTGGTLFPVVDDTPDIGSATKRVHQVFARIVSPIGTGQFYPATDGGAVQTAAGLFGGTGVPNNANGNNGDIYFRSDGGAGTTIYQRRAGAWVATGA